MVTVLLLPEQRSTTHGNGLGSRSDPRRAHVGTGYRVDRPLSTARLEISWLALIMRVAVGNMGLGLNEKVPF
jgi:hypothetical protein